MPDGFRDRKCFFKTAPFHRVMYRVAFDRSRLKKVRFVCEGTEYIVADGGIVLLSCLMKPNLPPVEHTEERFQSWTPELEIRPFGCEDFTVPEIVNPNRETWGPGEDYYRREKTRLLHLAAANRSSLWKRVFGVPEPQGVVSEPVIRYAQPDVWTPSIFEVNHVVPNGGNWGYRCQLCYFDADKSTTLQHILEKDHLRLASKAPDGIWADPSQSTMAVPSGAASSSSITTQPWPD